MKKGMSFIRFYSKKISVLVLAAFLTISSGKIPAIYALSDSSSGQLVFYTSPEGSTNPDGTENSPYTLTEVRAKIRELKKSGLPDGGITVYLCGGIYYQPETLIFGKEDSGTKECPITYKNVTGETAVIEGGYVLDPELYQIPSDEILSRNLTKDARNHLVAYDLKKAGVNYAPQDIDVRIDSRLYINGKRCWTGRYPNDDRSISAYTSVADPAGGNSYVDISGRVKNWDESSLKSALIYGTYDYTPFYGKISSYDPAENRVKVDINTSVNNMMRMFYFNVLEEIDAPGEYYIEEDTGMLYMYAPDGYKNMTAAFAQCTGSVIEANVDYYTFDGLTVEGGVEDLINISGNHNTVQNCKIRGCGENGISFSGSNINIFNNEIYYVGADGVYGESPNTPETIVSDSVIDNNLIHEFGELRRTYYGAIEIGTVSPEHSGGYGFTVSHNEMYNGPHLAVSSMARDLIIEYNYIHDVCYEASDAGAVYDGTWFANGYVLRHNVIANIKNKFNPAMVPIGYYCDNAGGGKQIYSNYFINIAGDAIAISGQDNDVHDNLFINSSMHTDSRAYYYIPGSSLCGFIQSAKFDIAEAERGYGGLWSWMMWDVCNSAYGNRYWAYRYPWTMLLKTTNVYDLNDRFVSYAFGDAKIRQNVFVNGQLTFSMNLEKILNIRDNLTLNQTQTIFTDYSSGDYSIPENSSVYHSLPGFKACDYANVGRYITE